MFKSPLIINIKFLFKLCLLIFCIYTSIDSYAQNFIKLDTSKKICEQINYKDLSYMHAVEKLMSLQLIKNWLITLNETNLALNSSLDKTKFLSKKCYWIIGFYEANDKKLTLWKNFEVEINGSHIYEFDIINPNHKNLIQHKNDEISK